MGRVALVTGGTRGIGAACSKALKDAGYNVAATYAGNDEAANAFKAENGIPVFKWDVADYAACEKGVAAVESEVGPVEVLVNNAGISRDAMLNKMSPEQWSQVMRTNLDSVFNVTRQVINGMRDRGFGRIISISSINGQQGMLGLSNYCAAKAGMIGFTRAVALEGARKGNREAMKMGLAMTWLLGATFLFIQINEYVHLGFSARDGAFGSIFYGLTGLHGAHVFVGLLLLSFANIRAWRGHFGTKAEDHLGVEVPGIYWHFVDVMWIIVYVTVYIL